VIDFTLTPLQKADGILKKIKVFNFEGVNFMLFFL